MIVGSLKNTKRVESISPLFQKAFEYIKANDLLNAELGTIKLEGDDLFVNNVLLEGKEVADAALEAHEEYADIHVVLEGKESIGWKAVEDVCNISVPYNKEKDLIFYSDAADSFATILPGQFCIVFPEDVHAPAISKAAIRKLIVKVRV